VQRSEEGVVHLVAEKLRDRTEALRQIDDSGSAAGALARADEMPPVLPRSRDFH
jgi:hypothetical protein